MSIDTKDPCAARSARNKANLASLPSVDEVAGQFVRAIYELHEAAEALVDDLGIANDMNDSATYAAWVVGIADIAAGATSACILAPANRQLSEHVRQVIYAIAELESPLRIAGRERAWVVAGDESRPWERYIQEAGA